MAYKITAPVKGYTGEGYGMAFLNGEAITENTAVAQRLKTMGYTVEEVGKQQTPAKKPIEKMTAGELVAYATEKGITLPEKSTKPDILAAIKAAEQQQ